MCNMADAGERFSAEAVSSNTGEVVVRLQLACRKTFAQKREISFLQCIMFEREVFKSRNGTIANLDTMSVVLYTQKLQTSLLDGNFDVCTACVNRVLEQFFEGRRRPLDDLHVNLSERHATSL